jgi:uncharacterized damage-inducible protein DinB
VSGPELLVEAVERIRQLVASSADGLDDETMAQRPGGTGNSVGWLLWHLVRVQDDHVAGVAGSEQVHTRDGFARRFGLDLDDTDIGYGHSSDEVDKVRVSAADVVSYAEAVCARTTEYLGSLSDGDLDRVVDDAYDPPVTLGARLVSVVSDDLQHLGQAAYVRGLLGA